MTSRSASDDETNSIQKYRYMLTIAKHRVKDFVPKGDLDCVYHQLWWSIPSLRRHELSYEISSLYKQLHMHAIVSTRKPVHYKKHCSNLGFRTQWFPIHHMKDSMKKASSYVNKGIESQPDLEEILLENYCNHHYLFTALRP